jgi:hypothetical protein
MTSLVSITIALLVFGVYVDFIWKKYGIQPSISKSVEYLPDNRKFIFSLVIAGFTVPLAIAASDMILMPIALGLIAMVGFAWRITDKLTKSIHVLFVLAGIALAGISMWFEYDMWYIVAATAALILVSLFFVNKRYWIWWVEIITFAVFSLGILIHLIK